MKRYAFGTLILGMVALGAMVTLSSDPASADGVTAGDTAADFTLPNYDGTEYSLSQYRDSTAIVVMFIATQCPVSNNYNERMANLARTYQPRGIQFIGINSNKQESVEEVANHARENGLPFRVLKDHRNVIADRFGATKTPEIYVLDPAMKVLYHGRIDDNQNTNRVQSHDLKDALDAILAGNPVPRPRTTAFGCTIKRVD